MTSSIKVVSDEKSITYINKVLKEEKIVNKGGKVKWRLVLKFYKLKNNTYAVTDDSEMIT